MGLVPVAKPVPAALSCWDQIFEVPGPPDFQTRYGTPLASVNADGSMDPPSDCWHTRGNTELSMNGPWGLLAVATEMHCVPLGAKSAV